MICDDSIFRDEDVVDFHPRISGDGREAREIARPSQRLPDEVPVVPCLLVSSQRCVDVLDAAVLFWRDVGACAVVAKAPTDRVQHLRIALQFLPHCVVDFNNPVRSGQAFDLLVLRFRAPALDVFVDHGRKHLVVDLRDKTVLDAGSWPYRKSPALR